MESESFKTFVSNSLDDLLSIYDSDTNDKSLYFNGYQDNIQGKWFKVKEDGQYSYYFEKTI